MRGGGRRRERDGEKADADSFPYSGILMIFFFFFFFF